MSRASRAGEPRQRRLLPLDWRITKGAVRHPHMVQLEAPAVTRILRTRLSYGASVTTYGDLGQWLKSTPNLGILHCQSKEPYQLVHTEKAPLARTTSPGASTHSGWQSAAANGRARFAMRVKHSSCSRIKSPCARCKCRSAPHAGSSWRFSCPMHIVSSDSSPPRRRPGKGGIVDASRDTAEGVDASRHPTAKPPPPTNNLRPR